MAVTHNADAFLENAIGLRMWNCWAGVNCFKDLKKIERDAGYVKDSFIGKEGEMLKFHRSEAHDSGSVQDLEMLNSTVLSL